MKPERLLVYLFAAVVTLAVTGPVSAAKPVCGDGVCKGNEIESISVSQP